MKIIQLTKEEAKLLTEQLDKRIDAICLRRMFDDLSEEERIHLPILQSIRDKL